jgi:hypothetical protein
MKLNFNFFVFLYLNILLLCSEDQVFYLEFFLLLTAHNRSFIFLLARLLIKTALQISSCFSTATYFANIIFIPIITVQYSLLAVFEILMCHH